MTQAINAVIGKPYDAENYNCYHLVRELVPQAPSLETVANYTTALRSFNKATYPGVDEVTKPFDGCVVLMGIRMDGLTHAGVFYQGFIVHADRSAVRAEQMVMLERKYPAMRFFQCK